MGSAAVLAVALEGNMDEARVNGMPLHCGLLVLDQILYLAALSSFSKRRLPWIAACHCSRVCLRSMFYQSLG